VSFPQPAIRTAARSTAVTPRTARVIVPPRVRDRHLDPDAIS
jgi:hypothetical protein